MHSRNIMPRPFASEDALTSAMVSIGMGFAFARAEHEPNIEDTLFAASTLGFDKNDFRVLSVLTMWLEVHSQVVVVDRLTRLVELLPPDRHRAYWVGIGRWLAKGDGRFRRLARAWPEGEGRVPLSDAYEYYLSRHGEDERFADGPLIVHAKALRRRRGDVHEPEEVAQLHRGYRFRLAFGARCSSDMWATLAAKPDLTAAALADIAYGSYSVAHDVKSRANIIGGVSQLLPAE